MKNIVEESKKEGFEGLERPKDYGGYWIYPTSVEFYEQFDQEFRPFDEPSERRVRFTRAGLGGLEDLIGEKTASGPEYDAKTNRNNCFVDGEAWDKIIL